MLRLVRAGARAWLPPTRCQRLSVLAEEAAQPPEKPEPVASPGPQAPVLRKCELPVPSHRRPVQAWVESLRGFEQERVGLAELHPDVFSTAPRLDILHQVAIWQKNFKRISYAKTKTRAEVRGGGRKPWPQKGSGRARHGSIRSPIWRGDYGHSPFWPCLTSHLSWPTSHNTQRIFLNLPASAFARYCPWPPGPHKLLLHAAHEDAGARPQSGADHQAGSDLCPSSHQDNLHIVDSLEMPTADPQYLTELACYRRWGDSVLLVDLVHEDMPQNMVAATSGLKTFNLIPAVGLNVHSMLKHQTLVLTLQTVAFLEEKLLWQDSRYSPLYPFRLPYCDFP
ncbi:39S ribosomal protein L4, mitochondrial isoform X2 [Pipistrellus kuhlii]|uniref:39S ribosomal protein L4, mitochondrial isoform X2 n=1 Tax=Pipistrellus kuhlii TaxID=59472 RepID=UPI001E2728F1|nr:39S ribosomal protein L4, mitochondrial isoform X2 [Pipistrellus kuhlii]